VDIHPKQRLQRAQALNQLQRYAEAETEARLALAGDVDRGPALCCLAMALLGQKKLEDADAASARAIAENPQAAHSYYVRAAILRARGDLTRAEAAARNAIARNPSVAFYYAELAAILLPLRRREEAVAAAELGMKLDPECLSLCHTYTLALGLAGRPWAARENATRTVTLNPENADSYIQLANIEFFQGDLADAEKHFRQALRLSPQAPEVRRALLVTLRGQTWLYRNLIAEQDKETIRAGARYSLILWTLLFPHWVWRFLAYADWWAAIRFFASYLAAALIVPAYLRSLYLPVSIFLLRLEPENRAVFSRREAVCSQVVTALFVLGLVLLACAAILHWANYGPLGVAVLALCIPVVGLFQIVPCDRLGVVFHAVFNILADCCAVLYTLRYSSGTGLIPLGFCAFNTMLYAVNFNLTVAARAKQPSPTFFPR
jgi:tetratricopeptide (TPR) repeat protein